MKRASGGYRAMQFESAFGTPPRAGGYADKNLYAIDNVPGIYRRVAEPKVSDHAAVGVIAAWYGDRPIFLTLDVALEKELHEVGVLFTRDWRVGPMETPEDVTLANEKARELAANPPATLLSNLPADGAPGTGETAPAPAPVTRKRRGTVTTQTGLPSTGSLEGSLIGPVVAELDAQHAPAPRPSIHDQIAAVDGPPGSLVAPFREESAPAPESASEVVPPGQVSPTTGLAPPGADW